jgi:hypothetical protein
MNRPVAPSEAEGPRLKETRSLRYASLRSASVETTGEP